MIIHKTNKTFITRSDKPNENFGGEDYYVVEDGTELANKILNTSKFDFVVENGELIDIEEIPKTQAELDVERIEQIHEELEELDTVISRGLEDLYELTGNTPYQRLQDVIQTKQDLREELRELGGELA